MKGIKDYLGFANDSDIRKLLNPDGTFDVLLYYQNRESAVCRKAEQIQSGRMEARAQYHNHEQILAES